MIIPGIFCRPRLTARRILPRVDGLSALRLRFDHFSPPKAPFPGQVDAIELFVRSIRPFPGHNSYRLGTADNITRLKKILTEKGLITKSVPMNYEISDPILSLWLKKECGRNRNKLYF